MFYEIGEHVRRGLRPFLHSESFQILDIICLLLWTTLFNSNHRILIWPLHNVDFVIVLISAWGYCLFGSVSLLAETTRFLAKMSWYLVKFMMPLTLRAPGPVEANHLTGMSKQLADSRQSYSMRSGALGTMGWNVLDDSRKVNPVSNS